MSARYRNSIRNIISGLIYQVVAILINIVSRKIFVEYFGVEVLGVNGVLSNVISMLSLTELGVGIAISQSLYKPIANGDIEEVKSIMALYRRLYTIIAFVILILGIICIPFLGAVVNTELSNRFVFIVYLLILGDTFATYFLGYFQNLLIADQKKYYVNNVLMISNLVLNLSQITATIITKNYFLFLLIKLGIDIVQNIVIYTHVKKIYPFLNEKNIRPLSKEYKFNLKRNVSGLLVANISTYIVFSTDNLLLSMICGATVVGLYSNYSMIIRAVKNVLSQVFQGITASFGNLLVLDDVKYAHKMFLRIFFANFWLCTFSFTSLVVLLNPFIDIWVGKKYEFSVFIVFILCWNFYSDTMRSSIELVRSAAGLYSPYRLFKYWSVLEAILNIVFSIFLGNLYGTIGVFLGTALSAVVSCYIIPWNVYKYVFDESSIIFYKKYIIYQVLTILIVGVTYYLAIFLEIESVYLSFLLKILLCLLVPNLMIFTCFFRTEECRYLIRKILRRKN